MIQNDGNKDDEIKRLKEDLRKEKTKSEFYYVLVRKNDESRKNIFDDIDPFY